MAHDDDANRRIDETIRAARKQVLVELRSAGDDLKRAVATGAVAVTGAAARPVLRLLDQAFDQLTNLLDPDANTDDQGRGGNS